MDVRNREGRVGGGGASPVSSLCTLSQVQALLRLWSASPGVAPVGQPLRHSCLQWVTLGPCQQLEGREDPCTLPHELTDCNVSQTPEARCSAECRVPLTLPVCQEG